MRAPFYIALRYLWCGARAEGGRYLRGAAAGIALSLIPIIVTLVVSDGMIRGITGRYIELGTGHIQLFDFFDGDIDFMAGVVSAVRDDPETAAFAPALTRIRGAWRERQGPGLILGSGGKTGATVRAVDPGFWDDPGSRAFLEVLDGSAVLESGREALLGRGLAETLNARPGSVIRLMTVRTNDEGVNVPRVTLFTVKGIISSGYRELDALWCVISYDAGQEILSPDPELYRSYLILKTADPYRDADKTAAELAAYLGPGSGVYAWQRLEQSLYSSLASTRQMLLFIMTILVLVAAVNVSSATSMLAIERQRDIAVLKTCGASPGKTTAVFLWGSFLTGLTGAAAGCALGLFIGRFINPVIRFLERAVSFFTGPWTGEVKLLDPDYYLAEIPVIIDWGMVALIAAFAVICSVLASWFPARKAGKLKPLEILRRV
jgi:lipoprotein-releasing system permease protein